MNSSSKQPGILKSSAKASKIVRPIGVAIIGAGERGVYFIGSRMAEMAAETGFRIIGLHDRLSARMEYASQHLNQLYQKSGIDHDVKCFAELADAVTDPDVDLVLVTTHTHAHREPTIAALAAGKQVYLDKPISVHLEDAMAIRQAELDAKSPIMMGFTRRYESSWLEAARLLKNGAIGSLHMMLLRSVIPYTRYLQLWHRNSALSGGAINDKCSHHFDVLNWFADGLCTSLGAVGGRSGIFAPDPTAPARCRDCDRDCPYRRHSTLIDEEEGCAKVPNQSWIDTENPRDRDDNCVYLPGADIDDHAIVTMNYDNGVKANLFFTMFGPWAKDQETLELLGSSGRLRLERSSGTIDLVSDHGHHHEIIVIDNPDQNSSHYGADRRLVRDMKAFCEGNLSPVGVQEGIASLQMVVAAQQSIKAGGQFLPISDEAEPHA